MARTLDDDAGHSVSFPLYSSFFVSSSLTHLAAATGNFIHRLRPAAIQLSSIDLARLVVGVHTHPDYVRELETLAEEQAARFTELHADSIR